MNLASYKNLCVERGRDSNKEGYLYDLSKRLGLVAGATFAWQKVISGIKCVSTFGINILESLNYSCAP